MDELRGTAGARVRRDGAWAWMLVGALAADACWLHARSPSPFAARLDAGVDPGVPNGPPEPPDPARASPRELRALPGIGEARAIAIARERWELRPGHTRALSEVDGIGPVTEGGIRALLDHARAASGRSDARDSAVDSSHPSHAPRLGLVPPSFEPRALRAYPASPADRPP